jgi:AcrR family transcriptional regulator
MKKLADSYENPLVTRSKQMLTEAFFELLKEKPGSRIKISKLCQKAGVARPTFYSHYHTIEEIPSAYFSQWLNDLKNWVDQQAQKMPPVILDPDNQFSSDFGKILYVYWCNEVELVKRLQNAGYEDVILQTFIKAHEYVMKELVAPVHDLSIYFQNFLQSKAGIVAYELYKYWIATDMQLSVEQLAKIHSALTTRREIIEITRIGMGESEE